MADVLVAGASGFAGALAARLVDRHPQLRRSGRVTSRSDAGRSLRRALPAPPRRRACSRSSTSTATRDVDAAIVAYPHGAAAPVVAGLRERGVKVVDLSADFRLRDRATYEQLVRAARAPELIGGAAYGLTELQPRAIARRRARREPGLLPDRRRCSRSRRSRAPG